MIPGDGPISGAPIGAPFHVNVKPEATPVITLAAVLICGDKIKEGVLVEAVAVPWFEIIRMIQADPEAIYQIHWRTWEEIIAGAYKRAGFDEVILTPRKGDRGKDVIAVKHGYGSVRIFDEVKAYKPGHVVTAKEVRALVHVINADQNVSKGIVTTTSVFASGVLDDPTIKPFLPHRLELKPRDDLLKWLSDVSLSQGK